MAESDNMEDILNDALVFLGEERFTDHSEFQYGPLTLSVAPKVCAYKKDIRELCPFHDTI
jgi:hypothetical protein